MPTYVYKCTDCEHRFEAVQGFHDDPLSTCPACGGLVRRVIGNVGVTFKGSGFYRTDSRAAAKATSGKTTTKASEPAKATDTTAKPAGDTTSSSATTTTKKEPKAAS